MTDNTIQFLSFDEAVSAALRNPDTEFVGLGFTPPFSHLDVYIVRVDADDPEHVDIYYEGGRLFDMSGEEEFYDLDDVPDDARSLYYARMNDLGDGSLQVMGMTSEAVLTAVLPNFDKGAKYLDHDHFRHLAGTQFRAYWRQE